MHCLRDLSATPLPTLMPSIHFHSCTHLHDKRCWSSKHPQELCPPTPFQIHPTRLRVFPQCSKCPKDKRRADMIMVVLADVLGRCVIFILNVLPVFVVGSGVCVGVR